MSYWYNRFTKKHVACLLCVIPVLLINSFTTTAGSYLSGCVPTASRTLYDWISVERGFNEFEVYPYVTLYLDSGCIEWLGFSTCEAVQFQDWMPYWMNSEVDTVVLTNITSVDMANPANSATAPLPSFTVDRTMSDAGTMAAPGAMMLKRGISFTLNIETSRLTDSVMTLAGAVPLGELIGAAPATKGMVYFDTKTAVTQDATITVPFMGNKLLKANSLYYYSAVHADARKCTFDDDCAGGCGFSTTCEPQGYGHDGTMMPSATFFWDWKMIFPINHWTRPAFKYGFYCSKAEVSCEKTRAVMVLNADTFTRYIFENEEKTDLEKYPDMEFIMWKAQGYARRVEGCDTFTLGAKGKDCGIPAEYTFIGPNLYLSKPADIDSVIYSEQVTGLKFDSTMAWQVNAMVMIPGSTAPPVFVPLFSVSRSPVTLVMKERNQFSSLKGYPGMIINMCLICWAVTAVTFGLFLSLFFYGMTCVSFCQALNDQMMPFKPNYI